MATTDKRYIRTHKLIRDVFEQQIIAKDYNDITISLITKEAGINRKTFYLHYESLNALMSEFIDDIVKEIMEYLVTVRPEKGSTITPGMLSGFFQLLSQKKSLHKRLICSPGYKFVFHEISDKLVWHNQTLITNSNPADNYAKRILMIYITHGIMLIYRDWLIHDCPISEEDLGKITEQLIINGISSFNYDEPIPKS